MSQGKPHAVLMGDLVGSSKAASKTDLHELFNRVVEDANQRCAPEIASPLTITLGDEFQGLAYTLGGAFDVVRGLRLRLLLERVEARFVVGAITLETELNRERAWNMMGEGLAEARAKLGDKDDTNRYRFSFPADPMLELLLDGIGRSLTRVEAGWTDTQRRYVARVLLDPETPKGEIASALGVSENSLYKVLRSAELRFYSRQIETIEEALSREDRRREAAA
ncbi:MAG TPA: SatD family protein [Gammaproteobacteria bacterium]